MASLRVIETTDSQHLGRVFELDPTNIPEEIPVGGGVYFHPLHVEQLGPLKFRFSNPNYVAIAEVVSNG